MGQSECCLRSPESSPDTDADALLETVSKMDTKVRIVECIGDDPQCRQYHKNDDDKTTDDVDCDLFETTNQCTSDNPQSPKQPNWNTCSSVKRVIHALKYYETTTKGLNQEGVLAFTYFIKSIYKNYLHDITHLSEVHGGDLEDIHRSLFNEHEFKPCDLKKCKISGRHSGVNRSEKDRNATPCHDAFSHFIRDSFDSVHFYLFHLFDVGMRTLRSDIDSEQKDDDEIDDEDAVQSKWVDRAFLRRQKRLKAVRNELTDYFKRYEDQQNKFVISKQTGDQKEIKNQTYIDRFVDVLSDCAVGRQRMTRYLMEQDFDTESIKDDVERYPNAQSSNLFAVLDDDDDNEWTKKLAYFVNRRRRTFCCSRSCFDGVQISPPTLCPFAVMLCLSR